jgi:hypothetical protein
MDTQEHPTQLTQPIQPIQQEPQEPQEPPIFGPVDEYMQKSDLIAELSTKLAKVRKQNKILDKRLNDMYSLIMRLDAKYNQAIGHTSTQVYDRTVKCSHDIYTIHEDLVKTKAEFAKFKIHHCEQATHYDKVIINVYSWMIVMFIGIPMLLKWIL